VNIALQFEPVRRPSQVVPYKHPKAPAVKREAEEDWGANCHWRAGRVKQQLRSVFEITKNLLADFLEQNAMCCARLKRM
jgi:hypothetical protein